ncbi:MAG: deoxyribodipyrimidine photolyase [Planctomycetes bacterium]|nr:deoxyribodipyrimidine photolyase [Planctomycetota bacterium]MBL7041760.1 deoxyribodipyrimidine photolyase [Pirellulaceae bacterium]
MSHVPESRIRKANDADFDAEGQYVLYWMTAFRRTEWNFSLQRAVDWARDLKKPLVVLESLRCGYRWACDRFHHFVAQGMADNAAILKRKNVAYYPYLEPKDGAGKGLLAAVAERACVVIADDFPCFFLPRMTSAAALQIPVRFELVDSNGILPMRAAGKVFSRAFDFRRFLQKNLRPHLDDFPEPDPLAGVRLPKLDSLPAAIRRKWPPAKPDELTAKPHLLAKLPIDHSVAVAPTVGGATAGQQTLRDFLDNKLAAYEVSRNEPEQEATSGLSPYLHFGHISAHQVFHQMMERDDWTPDRTAEKASDSSSGWWGASSGVEAFLDQLITWRELSYNMCWQREDYDRYDSLPDWAKMTLADHENDPREYVYSAEEFEAAETHDDLWNAAQRQLTREGRIHNYLRMLWGKKILEWSSSPEEALATMIALNNKYALDGRDPTSYSGIFWCLGRYDRAWGPERPIFGKVRYMSSENTARKFRVRGYIEKYSA